MSKIEFLGFSQEKELREHLGMLINYSNAITNEITNELYNTDLIRETLCFDYPLSEQYGFFIIANNGLPHAHILVKYDGSICEVDKNEEKSDHLINWRINWRDIEPKALLAFHDEANKHGYKSNWEGKHV